MAFFRSRKNALYLLLFLSLLLLCGCGPKSLSSGQLLQEEPPSDQYQIYYTNGEETMLLSAPHTAEETQTEGLIYELFDAMNQVPEEGGYKKVRPDNMNAFYQYQLNDSGVLTLYYDDTYTVLQGVKEVLYRAAVVETMTQIPGVNYVEFYVDDVPLLDAAGNQLGYMSSDDFLDNTNGALNYYQTTDMVLYFADMKGSSLVPIHIRTVYDGTCTMEQLVVTQLIRGPEVISGLEEGTVRRTVPEDTVINKVSISEGICYLDLSEEFLQPIQGISPELELYSIVNSLTELKTVSQVQFTINGEMKTTFQTLEGFDQFFERSLELIQEVR